MKPYFNKIKRRFRKLRFDFSATKLRFIFVRFELAILKYKYNS